MSKLIKGIAAVLITAAALFLLHFILTINVVDKWLSGTIGNNVPVSRSLIHTQWTDEVFGIGDADKPCIYEKDGRLMITAGAVSADITPEDINIPYYAKFTDFNDMIRSKKNCLVSKDGRYIIYKLEFNDIPYLYYFDAVLQKAFFISDRVDSFDIVENDGDNSLTLIYATGYDQFNKLFLYRSDKSGNTAGTNTLISENNKLSGVFGAYGVVVYINSAGDLYKYDAQTAKSDQIASNVEDIYFPGKDEYNYDEYYKDFTVCCVKDGKDSILNGTAEAEITGGYYNIIPKYTYTAADGTLYYYSLNNKRIVKKSGASETILFDNLGDIYHVFGYYPNSDPNVPGHIIAAAEDSLYALPVNGAEAKEMLRLPRQYRERANMLENHMEIYAAGSDLYYVSMLSSGSMVLNTKNPDSWMNKANSYNYGLTCIRKSDNGAYKSEELRVPPSRSMNAPVSIDLSSSGKMIYASYYANGSMKAVSLLSEQGVLLSADMLGTANYAEDQCSLQVFPCYAGTYILQEIKGGEKGFYMLGKEAQQLDPVMDKNGLFTKNYKDFSAAASFGLLVIF